jgi:PadR family transcriptional regulator PadR
MLGLGSAGPPVDILNVLQYASFRMSTETQKAELLQGTLDLMLLRTLETMGPQHGFGLAKRIQQISNGALDLNQGTLYPALLRLEQRGWIRSSWGKSDKNRRAKFYELTKAGRRQIGEEQENWGRTVAVMARFLRTAE